MTTRVARRPGAYGRRAELAREEAHLAEVVSRAERRELRDLAPLEAHFDGDGAALDDVEGAALLSLPNDDLAGAVGLERRALGQHAPRVVGHRLHQGDRAEGRAPATALPFRLRRGIRLRKASVRAGKGISIPARANA